MYIRAWHNKNNINMWHLDGPSKHDVEDGANLSLFAYYSSNQTIPQKLS